MCCGADDRHAGSPSREALRSGPGAPEPNQRPRRAPFYSMLLLAMTARSAGAHLFSVGVERVSRAAHRGSDLGVARGAGYRARRGRGHRDLAAWECRGRWRPRGAVHPPAAAGDGSPRRGVERRARSLRPGGPQPRLPPPGGPQAVATCRARCRPDRPDRRGHDGRTAARPPPGGHARPGRGRRPALPGHGVHPRREPARGADPPPGRGRPPPPSGAAGHRHPHRAGAGHPAPAHRRARRPPPRSSTAT